MPSCETVAFTLATPRGGHRATSFTRNVERTRPTYHVTQLLQKAEYRSLEVERELTPDGSREHFERKNM